MSEFQSRMVALLAARDRVVHAVDLTERAEAESAFDAVASELRAHANPQVRDLLHELDRQVRFRTSAS